MEAGATRALPLGTLSAEKSPDTVGFDGHSQNTTIIASSQVVERGI